MADKLLIVESPAKANTIKKFLGGNTKVVASMGHIRDLPKSKLGVDIEHDFEPEYINIRGKGDLIKSLKKDAKQAKKVYLATDPDREGEAIAWHLSNILSEDKDKMSRVTFNEITKTAVQKAIKQPREIDKSLVDAQQARRVLDRIVGYKMSPVLWKKVKRGLSAGRVQSVAVKLIVDREEEIENFIPEEYWNIFAELKDEKSKKSFEARFFGKNGKKQELHSGEEVDKILADVKDAKYMVTEVKRGEKKRTPAPPFTTSTMQQEASRKLGFTLKKTMSVAQGLYEGVRIPEKGTIGLITYMRTDSIRLSDEFIGASYKYIEENYGKDYIGYAKKSKKTENVQDAHEAIRPTSVYRNPEDIKKYLSTDEYKLYKIIYYRALASLMADAKVEATSVILDNNNYQFKINGQILIYDGYLKAYALYETSEDKVLPDEFKNEGSILTTTDVTKKQHFTSPPPRYTEAKLIKELEELGIGRPSTYAKIMDTIKERGYVTIEEKKFVPTEIGIETTDRLQEFFSDLINVKYTAAMETDLDTIALGKLDEIKVLREFYDKFEPEVEKAFGQMEKKAPKETGEVCPNCGSSLVIRKGRYGEFTACSNYPECKYIKKEEKQVKEIMDCPKSCGKIIEKKTKRGKIFYGCNNYPKCKYASWDKPTGNLCKECGEPLVEKNGSETCPNCNKQ